MNKTNTLSFRVNAAIWTVCAAILLIFIFVFFGFENQQRLAQTDQAKVLLESLYQQKREELANDIFANHREALSYTLSEIHDVKGVGAVHIFDTQGHLLQSVGIGKRDMISEDKRLLLNRGPLFEEVQLAQRNYLTFTNAVEVIGERLGYFSVFFDLSDLHKASRQRVMLIVGVFGSMLIVLSMLLHLLLTHSVIAPVSRIRNAMNQVMKGHLGEQVTMQLGNEIGEVAAAFNTMSTQLKEQRQRLLRSMNLRDSYAEQLEKTNRKLARLNADLESIVDERTLELRTSNEQLRAQIHERILADQARHDLENQLARSQKMEALGLLAGGVAHDLNNVLSGIVSYPDLILMDLMDGDPLIPLVDGIQRSGQKAAAIVQDLLTLARRGVTHSCVLNLNDDIVNDYLRSPEFKKMVSYHLAVTIETRLSSDLMNIQGSAIHLKKAVMNLVSNAAEAQPYGGRIIIVTENCYVDRPISGYNQVNEGDYVVLRVEDMGLGIAPTDLNRIFEPFYTKKVMGRSGTGLGMAVVWGTVQDHKGYINVRSQLNKGTTFELYFPVTREKADNITETISLDACMGKGEKVLVVDDVAEQRDIAAALLTRLKYKVATVDCGEAALVYLEDHHADILVLDMIMDPGMDGLDTYIQIFAAHPGQKAIIASGYAESERVKEAQRLGAGAYIRKPYTIEKIGMAVRTELDR